MSGTLSPRERQLASALAAAKNSARIAGESRPDDGGSANLDSAFLTSPGLTAACVRKAAAAAGVNVDRHRSRWWNGWFVHVQQGQGAMRTRMAEAAVKAMKEAGEEASVYYQVD